VAAQEADRHSLLRLYRAAIAARRQLDPQDFAWLDAPEGVLRLRRGDVEVLINLSGDPVPVPAGELLLASEDGSEGQVPSDAGVWVRTG
jgi:alpha-glucosidase